MSRETPVIRNILSALARLGIEATRINAGGRRGRITLSPAGWPDILAIVPPRGQALCIEVKAEDGAQSDSQEVFQARVERLGARYVVVRSLDEAIAAVNDVRRAAG